MSNTRTHSEIAGGPQAPAYAPDDEDNTPRVRTPPATRLRSAGTGRPLALRQALVPLGDQARRRTARRCRATPQPCAARRGIPARTPTRSPTGRIRPLR
ncbi:hypothetical protein FRAAL5794 [Frankia alni ACN14a]|uniref:Uncharacterized protein n=1 Tax=Frankia alni (strain DSM 45986 / CECT 9034 / ACN14a) TaxID=326424 RepID=Q0RDP0_FRAAA|nr:hypothetical protein FRAAL5794 [Frankia alni ACN14a]